MNNSCGNSIKSPGPWLLIIFLIESFYSIIYDLGELNNEDYCQKKKQKSFALFFTIFHFTHLHELAISYS